MKTGALYIDHRKDHSSPEVVRCIGTKVVMGCLGYVVETVGDLGPERPVISCECTASRLVAWVHKARSFTLIDVSECKPVPSTPSQRRDYAEGDTVYVARLCGTLHFDKSTVMKTLPDKQACVVEGGGYSYANVKYEHMYLVDGHLLRARCSEAVMSWFHVTSRMKIGRYKSIMPKDVRKLIGRLIWETRDDREWERQHKHKNPPRKAHKKIKTYQT